MLDFGKVKSSEISSSIHPMLMSLSSGGMEPSPKPMQKLPMTTRCTLVFGDLYLFVDGVIIMCLWYMGHNTLFHPFRLTDV